MYSIIMCLSTSCLLASLYTYDHENCMPRNFLIPQQIAEAVGCAALFLIAFPLIFMLLIPTFWRRLVCCKRAPSEKIAIAELNEQGIEVEKKELKSRKMKCYEITSRLMEYLILLYEFVVIILFFLSIILIHAGQYKTLEGDFINSAGNNEIFSFFYLLCIMCLYK